MKGACLVVATLAVLLCVTLIAGSAGAQEKIVLTGFVEKIDLPNKTVVIKDARKQETTIFVEDRHTLKKLESGCIAEGDFVRIKYVVKDGKKMSVFFFPEPIE